VIQLYKRDQTCCSWYRSFGITSLPQSTSN